jgi:pimeloyl-ACP methyl ester carboxylesterase
MTRSVTMPLPEQGFWTRVAGDSIHGDSLTVYAAGAEGLPAMLFLHGLEDSYLSWEPLARQLCDRFRCYAVDLPWRPGGNFEWRVRSTSADWVDAVLGVLPEPATIITAHSFGANSVLRWLEGKPVTSARSLVLLSPFYRAPSTPVSWLMFDRALEDFRGVMAEGMRVRLGERADQMDPDVFARMVQKTLERTGPHGFIALFDQLISSSQLSLKHVDIPTLIVAGSEDPGISGEKAEALAADMPVADVRLYPSLTHFCHAEQSTQVAALMNQFLAPFAYASLEEQLVEEVRDLIHDFLGRRLSHLRPTSVGISSLKD